MVEVGKRIKNLREKHKLNQLELAKELGFNSASTVANWESGVREPELETLLKVADYFGVSLEYLLRDGDGLKKKLFNDIDKALKATDLKAEARSEVFDIVKEKIGIVANPKMEYRLEAVVPAGLSEISDLTEWYASEVLDYDPQAHFFLEVDKEFGYSMMPLIQPGDLLLCSTKAKVQDNDIVAARWDKTKGAVKIVTFMQNDKSHLVLTSYNQAIPPIYLLRKEVSMYKVVLIKKGKRK